MSVAGTNVAVCDTLKSLGLKLDSTLSFNHHVTDVVRSCSYHIRVLRHLLNSLSRDTANTVARNIVGSRLDYCNSLFYGAGEKTLNQIQRIQNNLTRVVCSVGRHDVCSEKLL